jgi:hypothetical protein
MSLGGHVLTCGASYFVSCRNPLMALLLIAGALTFMAYALQVSVLCRQHPHSIKFGSCGVPAHLVGTSPHGLADGLVKSFLVL